jgi:hypothetical protein
VRESLNLVWGRVLREAREKWNQNNTIAKPTPLLSTIRLILFQHGVLLTLLHNLTVGYSYIRFHLEVMANEVKLYKARISCFKIANFTTVFLLFPSLDCHYILNKGSKDLIIAYKRWRFETKPPGRMFSSLT